MAFPVAARSALRRHRMGAILGAAVVIVVCVAWLAGFLGQSELTPSETVAAPSETPPPESAPLQIRTVSQEIPIEGRALLDTIAGSESNYAGRNPYTVIFGGVTATSLADHPRQDVPIRRGRNTGRTTSAAGRYQYLQDSWDEAREALGLPDFSAESQDKAAFWEAQRTYKTKTGRDLVDDIKKANGDPKELNKIGRALSNWWTNLPGGIEPNEKTKSFGERFAENLAYYGEEASEPVAPGLGSNEGTKK